MKPEAQELEAFLSEHEALHNRMRLEEQELEASLAEEQKSLK